MAAYQKYQNFVEDLGKGVHNLSTNTLKLAFTNTTPNLATHTVLADIGQIATGGGYTGGAGGGLTVDSVTYTETGGTATLTGADETITASGGSINTFRYVVLYNDTPTSPADPLIAVWDYGSSISPADGESFTIDFGANIFTLA